MKAHWPRIVIVCPAGAEANNGNWRTARRWQTLLRGQAQVRIVQHWPDALAARDELMLALHARKSAPAAQAWHAQRGAGGLGVVLTGTDLYPDITRDALALRTLDLADGLLVLQPQALLALPQAARARAQVVLQSCPARETLSKTTQRLRVLMVGHLREEKNPAMLWRAVQALSPQAGVLVEHIGQALSPAMAQAAQAVAERCPHYRWLGARTHGQTLQRIQRAHLLVHTSRSEGGAIVLSEALRCGTPVLATRIDGNVGVLGSDYAGFVAPDDDAALAQLLLRCRQEQRSPQGAGLLQHWQQQCAARAPLFAPERERAALLAWVQGLRRAAA